VLRSSGSRVRLPVITATFTFVAATEISPLSKSFVRRPV
jgi:hypothetical protein